MKLPTKIHQDDPDKAHCEVCGKLATIWRMRVCHFCGLRMCQLCWGKHFHNEA
jgi:hypothetical protein